MKQNIVAIGGGDIRDGETLQIDNIVIQQVSKHHPKLLFVPTASSDNEGYIKAIEKYFTELGCIVDSLCLYDPKITETVIAEKLAMQTSFM